jgi:hypothetical protein
MGGDRHRHSANKLGNQSHAPRTGFARSPTNPAPLTFDNVLIDSEQAKPSHHNSTFASHRESCGLLQVD